MARAGMTDSRTDATSTDTRHGQATTPAEVDAVIFGDRDSTPERPDGAASADSGDQGSREPREKTLLEQMGGVVGLVSSTIPVLVFIVINAVSSLQPAIWAALGAAVLIAVWRIVRKEPLQPAVSGVLGVALCAFIAYRTGSAKGFFLFGIWTSLLYGGAFLVSIVVRWPLAGVAWSVLNNTGFAWRANRRVLRGYDLATGAWTAVFLARFVVQHWLYNSNQTGWLEVARIGMGYPLTALALLVTVWAIRRERALTREHEAATAIEPHAESAAALVPAAESPAATSHAVEPTATESAVAEPTAPESAAPETAATEPAATEAETAEPAATEQTAVTEPVASDAPATGSDDAKASVTEQSHSTH